MTENINLNQQPISQEWLDYCEQLAANNFAEVEGLGNAELYSEQSIRNLSAYAQKQYQVTDNVPPKVQKAHEAYLGQYVLHNSGGKWIEVTQSAHNISARAVSLPGGETFIIPAELWKLLFIPMLSDALLDGLNPPQAAADSAQA